jgi:hypothetical protein
MAFIKSCKMGSHPLAVVDDQLRVHGLDGPRVIDASIMPRLVSGNTNAPTILIAEKGSDFILGRRCPRSTRRPRQPDRPHRRLPPRPRGWPRDRAAARAAAADVAPCCRNGSSGKVQEVRRVPVVLLDRIELSTSPLPREWCMPNQPFKSIRWHI